VRWGWQFAGLDFVATAGPDVWLTALATAVPHWTTSALGATAVLAFSGVPSIAGEVDTAAEHQRVIDDRDFLVRDGAGRMCAMDGELQPLAAQPINRATGVTLPQRPSNAGSRRTFDRNR
jgi:hypothetical protein